MFDRSSIPTRCFTLLAVLALLIGAGCTTPTASTPPGTPGAPATSPDPGTSGYDEAAVAEFYEGKTIRIVMGLDAGSGADLTARLVAEHIQQYIPGTPNVIVENVTGGGGILAANQVYNTAPRDGTVIGTPLEGFALLQLLEAEGIEFDTTQFQWIGSLLKSPSACLARTDSGVDSIEDIMSGGDQLTVASTGTGGTPFITASVLREALGADIEIVGGYDGTGEAGLAIESGEVEGYCVSLSAMITSLGTLLEGDDPTARIFVVMGPETPDHPLLEGVPAAQTLAEDDSDRAMLSAVHGPSQITRPFAFPPEVPADRVAALRAAFAATMADQEFLDAAEQAGVDLDPSTGAEVESVVNDILATPEDVAARLQEALDIEN